MTSFAQRLQKDIDNLALYFQSKDRVKAGCKQVDLSKPPSGVLIQDGFLSEVEIEAAEAQLKQMQEQRSLKERFLIATKQKSHAELSKRPMNKKIESQDKKKNKNAAKDFEGSVHSTSLVASRKEFDHEG